MNRHKILLFGVVLGATISCLQVESFEQDVFVYEPVGEHATIRQLKSLPADTYVDKDIYVQGVVTSSDADGNYAQCLVFQDETDAVGINVDLGSSNKIFAPGQKISVQVKGMMLGEINGVLYLGSSVSGSGLQKKVNTIDNRSARNSVFAVEGGSLPEPVSLTLSELDAGKRTYEQFLVQINDVFFQTSDLPFANEGGSSEQYRTLYDDNGNTILLCTNDASTMAGQNLPEGKGFIVGILTYPNGSPVIMARSIEDFVFNSGLEGSVNDPDDKESDLMITEYYSFKGAYYVEICNVGKETVNLNEYALACDTSSDGVFSRKFGLEDRELAPFGIAIYANTEAADMLGATTGEWNPLRTNWSSLSLDVLELDGNSQVAIMKGDEIVDILSTTNRFNWAYNKTLVRRPNIKGHSKGSDYTRADAGWITYIAGYGYNRGYHRFFDTDPDFDAPSTVTGMSILEARGLAEGTIKEYISVTGRVTSDREAGNVGESILFMQDASNRGICIAFREGQKHDYDPGDEVTVELYGAAMFNDNGLLIIKDAAYSLSQKTDSPSEMPEAIEASVSQIENLQSMYIYIKDVQIKEDYLSGTYGQGNIPSEDLFANEFQLKCLETAAFSDQPVSGKSGIVKGIASKAGNDLMVMPRNEQDLEGLVSSRFTAITATPVTVSDMKKYAAGIIADDVRVTATVVTDNTGGNMPSNLIYLQDESEGFLLQLEGDNTYQFGQSLIIVLNGASLSDNYIVTPASSSSVVAVGAPDPSILPKTIAPSEIEDNLCKLVTVSGVQVSEEYRTSTFGAMTLFDAKGISQKIRLFTTAEAAWFGGYMPNAAGEITGLISANSEGGYDFYPRKAEDIAGLPRNGQRLDGEKVVYFIPSEDPKADLFISETVMGDLDAQGNLLSSVARNKCNSKFVELYNPLGKALDLGNYRVACIKYNNGVARSDIAYWQFPEGVMLSPGHTVVFKYVSCALGTSTGGVMSNTLWPKGYTGDTDIKEGVTVSADVVPGVIICFDARDYTKNIANSTQSFPAFDGNDILVVQKTADGGATWTEIDRVFSLPTADGTFGGKVSYPFLKGYQRKPGKLGTPGNITDVQDPAYAKKESNNRNQNDFDSKAGNPVADGAADWTVMSLGDVEDLGVHTFSIE